MPRVLALLLAAACAATEPGGSTELQLARDRAIAANALVLGSQVENLAAVESPTIDQVLDADKALTREQRRRIRALAEEGAVAAERAVVGDPEDVAGHMYLAMNLALIGLVQPMATNLVERIPTRFRDAVNAALRLDRTFQGGAPLSLKGRFFYAAPWPLRSFDKAAPLLEEAVRVGPFAVHWITFGDLRWRQEREDEARAAWEHALTAEIHPTFRDSADQMRALARLRLSIAPHR